ncbi:MAG: carbohydrate kinase family protein [Pseudomonadota bacterium]|nr:carbohydrate kinase family protein [Pseudomonadota bacterium]
MSYDIVAVGSATVDQFADTDSELIRIETPTMQEKLIAFPLGSKILVKELNLAVGGGGTNCAVTFARLGLKTAYLGKVGTDGNGDFVVRTLQQEHIDFIGPREGTTGISVILNSFAHDRTILAYKGCNNSLRLDEIKPFETRWVYLASMLGESFDTIVSLLAQQDYRVAFNPSNYQAELGFKALQPLLEKVEILVMNLEEACKFLGLIYQERPPARELLKKMAELPPRVFVITDGGDGVHVYDRENYYRAWPREGLRVLETTGAGDAFASTFTAACVLDEPIEQAIHLGMTNAESVLVHQGAKEKLLSREELYQQAQSFQRKIEKQAI